MSVELLGERLVAGGFLTSEQRNEVVAQQLTFTRAGYHVPFGHIVVMMGYAQREDVEAVARGQHRENLGEVLQSAIGVLAISVGLTGILPQLLREIPSLPAGTLLQNLFGSLSVVALPLFLVGSTAAVASVLSTRDWWWKMAAEHGK